VSKDDFFTEQEMADLLGIDLGSLRSRRSKGKNHPPYFQSNKRAPVLFPKKEVKKWMDERIQYSINEAS
jgi:hypothetical protein